MNKKMIFFAAMLLAGTTLFAGAPVMKEWTATEPHLEKKNPGIITHQNGIMTLKGIPGKSWCMFHYIGVKSEQGKTISITFTAAGKGKVYAGYFGYQSGYNLAKSEAKLFTLTEKPTEYKLEFPLDQKVKIVRSRFNLTPDSEINISDFKVEIK